MAKPETKTPRPRLRPLQTFPVREGSETRLAITDPEGLAEGVVVASSALWLLLTLLDGTRDRAAIGDAWKSMTGDALDEEDLARVLAELDENLLLEGDRVETARRGKLAEYRAQARRAPEHAGAAYPEERDACATFLERQIAAAGDLALPDSVAAVLAPHIDLRGGGPCHGAAARAIARSPAEVFVVLGTAHSPIRRPFALTTLDFETPVGVLPTDRDLVARLASRGGGGLLDDELAHRGEHSVEFQALWIRHVHRERKDARIVPVLVGSLHERIADGKSPMSDPAIRDFVEALRALKADLGDRLAVVASVDFAHVGPRYGHPKAPSPEEMDAVRRSDQVLLEKATSANAEGWIQSLHAEGDRWNVCGAAPTYVLLATIAGTVSSGQALRHDAWEIDPDSGSQVTFASIAYGAR